jgi:branched-subunit amino acid ABC-type transport system permease component
MAAQIIVLVSSSKDKDKKAVVQSLILMGALGLILVSVLLRPKSPPNPAADTIASLGALFLLTPGVEALLKLRQYDEKQADRGTKGKSQ